MFGTDQKVQRCRAHKLRNVLDCLPKDDKPQVKSLLRAAWKLDADKGIARIKKLAAWLDQRYPQAAPVYWKAWRSASPSIGWTPRPAPLPGHDQHH